MIRRVIMVAALIALLNSVAPAQRGGGGGRGGGASGGVPSGFDRAPRLEKPEMIATEFKLRPDQQTAIEAIMDDAQKQAEPLIPKLIASKSALLNLSVQGQDTEEATKQLASLDAQMLSIETTAFSQALAKLDDKQKSKAPNLFDLMAGMFTVPGGWRKSN
jgi:hypothetical protein